MAVYKVDPLQDKRWWDFVQQHPHSSVFHQAAWLDALRRTYGYLPVVFTTSPPGARMTNGLVFCEIDSWLTGCRLVSLPFSDHCQPLVDNRENLTVLISHLENELRREEWKYIELRPLGTVARDPQALTRLAESETFCFHKLDLRPTLDDLFLSFHKSRVQRRIKRAERERLTYEEGRTGSILQKFYRLLLFTRRRHHLPPQPLAWFLNLIHCLGDTLMIRVVSQGNEPIASILTLSFRNSLVYKYGCSNASFHNLGGIPLLFWRAIQEGKRLGAEEFDLGRSELDNKGLITFKDNWGTSRTKLTYYRYPKPRAGAHSEGSAVRFTKQIFRCMPDSLLTAAGRLLYRHIG